MSDQKAAPRPRQVTLAVVVALSASVLLVLGLFDSMAGVRSEETRTAIEDFLSQPPGDGLGLEVTQVVDILRALVFITAAFATATAVLAIFVLQRHGGARIAFTVAAGLLLLTAPVSGLLPFLVAVAAALLWTAPARAWFAGRAYSAPDRSAEAPSGPGSDAGPTAGQLPQPPGTAGPSGPSRPQPHPAFGSPPPPAPLPASPEMPPPPHPSWGYPPPAYPLPPGGWSAPAARRPVTVTLGVAITMMVTTLVAALFAIVAVMLAVSGDRLLEEVQRDPSIARLGVSRDQLVASLWVGVAAVLLWCVAAIVLAVLTYLRKGWARILLTVSGGVAAIGGLLTGAAGIVLVLLVVPALVLLYAGGANQWFAGRAGPSSGGGGPPPPYSPNPQYPPYPPYPPNPPNPPYPPNPPAAPPGRPGPW